MTREGRRAWSRGRDSSCVRGTREPDDPAPREADGHRDRPNPNLFASEPASRTMTVQITRFQTIHAFDTLKKQACDAGGVQEVRQTEQADGRPTCLGLSLPSPSVIAQAAATRVGTGDCREKARRGVERGGRCWTKRTVGRRIWSERPCAVARVRADERQRPRREAICVSGWRSGSCRGALRLDPCLGSRGQTSKRGQSEGVEGGVRGGWRGTWRPLTLPCRTADSI